MAVWVMARSSSLMDEPPVSAVKAAPSIRQAMEATAEARDRLHKPLTPGKPRHTTRSRENPILHCNTTPTRVPCN